MQILWLKLFFGVIFVGLAAALAVIIIRFNRKRLHIIRAAAGATDEQLECIYRRIEASSAEAPNGFILGRTNKQAHDERCLIAIPHSLENFPWAGRVVQIEVERDVKFRFADESVGCTRLLGKEYRAVAVPRSRTKTGKLRNTFSPQRYISESSGLREKLTAVCPRYPEELLSYLLCAGRESFEFEPIDQARIGTSAAWVQDPEFKYCPLCKRRMSLIIQLPGTLAHRKAFHRGTFFLFGCATHPDQTASSGQFT